jgi:hypothetical protein
MAEHTPLVILDAIYPEVIQTLLAVPATKQIDHVVDWIDAHGMTATGRRHIAICVCAVKSLPDCVRLGSKEIWIKKTSFGDDGDKLFCSFPVPSEDYAFMELCNEGMFKLNPRSWDDGFIRS